MCMHLLEYTLKWFGKEICQHISVEQYCDLPHQFNLVCHKEIPYVEVICVLMLVALLFSNNRISLLLSWYIVVTAMGSPCGARKCLVYKICATTSSIATGSIEILDLSFCLHSEVYAPPVPTLKNMPL